MDIIIRKGNPISENGGKLNSIALDYMAYPLMGTKDNFLIENTLKKLWKLDSNRFSHKYAYEAVLYEKTVGMITCFPASEMTRLGWSTFQQLIKIRKWPLVSYSVMHLKELFSMLTLDEGKEDEYHIATLATLPESRGYGIGSKLIQKAEDMARYYSYDKCSLTVKKDNEQALKLYEKLGYEVVTSIDKNPYHLYRMVKKILPATL